MEPAAGLRAQGPSATPIGLAAAGHLRALANLLQRVDLGELELTIERLRQAREEGATVFIAGNGGSAATASHWVNDLCKATRCAGRPLIRATSLSDNTSWLTALANDEGYERVFAAQLENLGRPGDILVVISASGNSPNLVAAVEAADELGVDTVALLGFDGGALRDRVKQRVWLSTLPGEYELVEDAHAALCHAMTVALKSDLPVDQPSA
jgi:D-sedoheptulose 7-phosphate isomerase